MKKRILDVTAKDWSDEAQAKLKKKLREYKYKVDFEMPDGTRKFAYTNDAQVTTDYMKAFGYKILKVTKI